MKRNTTLFTGDGEMAGRLRAFDWQGHPLGPPEAWASELKAAVGICMPSSMPTAIYWGPELRLIYNDAWSPIPDDRHPGSLGEPAAQVWSDIWDVVGPQFRDVVDTKRGFTTYDQLLRMKRRGAVEETYWNYSLSPIVADDGSVVGVFNQGHETTDKVMASRAQSFLIALGDRLRDMTTGQIDPESVLSAMLGAVGPYYGVGRAGYAILDASARRCTVAGDWCADGVSDIAGAEFRLDDFGDDLADDLLAGRVVTSNDVRADARRTNDMVERFEAYGARSHVMAPLARGGRTMAFLFLNSTAPRRWASHEIELARELASRIWLAIEHADAASSLRTSEARFATIFGQASVGMSEVDRTGRFLRFNESMARLLGRSTDEARNLTVADVTHPDDVETTQERLAEAVRSGEPFDLEKRYVRPDGATVWAVTNVTRLVDRSGQTSGFFSVTTDVTERKEQERIRAWLLAELNHRVKNNLSTVQALAHHSRTSTASPEEFERVFNARLMALSRAHDLLMRETWTSAGLGELVNDTLAPFTLDDGDRIVIGGPEVRLSPTAAVTMTLAFHELATNAAKFGALSRPEGRVTVRWSVDRSKGGGSVDLEWREADGPIVVPPERRGFGSRLIERGAARELGGEVRLDFEPEGVACAFHLPLSQKITSP